MLKLSALLSLTETHEKQRQEYADEISTEGKSNLTKLRGQAPAFTQTSINLWKLHQTVLRETASSLKQP